METYDDGTYGAIEDTSFEDYDSTADGDTELDEYEGGYDDESTVLLGDGTRVSLDELERGYLRQSDYTRKTQSLASERAELAQATQLLQALESDPQGTLEALQRHIGVEDDGLSDLDPVERELMDHREYIDSQRMQSMQAEVENELSDLEEEYGEFDWDEVLEFAIDREIPDLEAALLLYDTELLREDERQQANAEALNRKRGGPRVSQGSRVQGQVSTNTSISSVMDAWNAAKHELGYE